MKQPGKRGPGRPRIHPPKDPSTKRPVGRPPGSTKKPKVAEDNDFGFFDDVPENQPAAEDEPKIEIEFDATTPRGISSLQKVAFRHPLTPSVLSTIFRRDLKTTQRRLLECPKAATRSGYPVYDLGEAAAYLVDPKFDVEDVIRSMRTQDLPQHLQSEFWKAQRNKIGYLRETGALWKAERVELMVADFMKIIFQQVRMMKETVEQQMGLTKEQRTLLSSLQDSLLLAIQSEVNAHFSKWEGEDKEQEFADLANRSSDSGDFVEED